MEKEKFTKSDLLLLILNYRADREGIECKELKKEMAGFYRRVLSYNPKNLELDEILHDQSYLGFVEKTEKECMDRKNVYYSITRAGKHALGARVIALAKDDKTYNRLEEVIHALGN